MSETLADLVLQELRRHGLEPGPGEGPQDLRGRLNERYLEAIRALKARLLAGEFPASDYAARVQRLKEDHPLLGVPLDRWSR